VTVLYQCAITQVICRKSGTKDQRPPKPFAAMSKEHRMRYTWRVLLSIFTLASCISGQEIKVKVVSAFVWGEDSASGAISSTIRDPLTGNDIRKLTYGSIEVSSRIGFEGVTEDEVGTFLIYATTIVNDGDSILTVRYGGISVDGRSVSLPWVIPPGKKPKKHERSVKSNAIELDRMQCLTNGFFSDDHLFSAGTQSQTFSVSPRSALTVSSVIRDPRSYSIRCSIDGCHPVGTIRYYLTVNSQDYVFVWPGGAAIYCGK
jgi:hypothetical protein